MRNDQHHNENEDSLSLMLGMGAGILAILLFIGGPMAFRWGQSWLDAQSLPYEESYLKTASPTPTPARDHPDDRPESIKPTPSPRPLVPIVTAPPPSGGPEPTPTIEPIQSSTTEAAPTRTPTPTPIQPVVPTPTPIKPFFIGSDLTPPDPTPPDRAAVQPTPTADPLPKPTPSPTFTPRPALVSPPPATPRNPAPATRKPFEELYIKPTPDPPIQRMAPPKPTPAPTPRPIQRQPTPAPTPRPIQIQPTPAPTPRPIQMQPTPAPAPSIQWGNELRGVDRQLAILAIDKCVLNQIRAPIYHGRLDQVAAALSAVETKKRQTFLALLRRWNQTHEYLTLAYLPVLHRTDGVHGWVRFGTNVTGAPRNAMDAMMQERLRAPFETEVLLRRTGREWQIIDWPDFTPTAP